MISDKVWEYLKNQGAMNFEGVEPDDPKLNYCAANAKFIKSVIFACSVKDHGIQEKGFKGLPKTLKSGD
jgi:hypothetical protein